MGSSNLRVKSAKAMPGSKVRDSGFCIIFFRQKDPSGRLEDVIFIKKNILLWSKGEEAEKGGGRTREGLDALTASLWRQRCGGEVKYMQRMGMLNSLASSVQYALVSVLAFVLSIFTRDVSYALISKGRGEAMHTDGD